MQRVHYKLLVIQHGGASENQESENDEVLIYFRSAHVHTLNVQSDLVYAVMG